MFYEQLSVESMNHLKVNCQLLLEKVHAVFLLSRFSVLLFLFKCNTWGSPVH